MLKFCFTWLYGMTYLYNSPKLQIHAKITNQHVHILYRFSQIFFKSF